MTDIFLSYSRRDQARAKLFADAFERGGFKVWWDVGLEVGDQYDEVIEKALRAAKAVVVLWSPDAVASHWVRSEASVGRERGRLAPALIADCELPVMFRLIQTADLACWKGAVDDPAWTAFLAQVRKVSARDEAAAALATKTDDQAQSASAPFPVTLRLPRRRNLLIGAGATLAVAAVGIGGASTWRWRRERATRGAPVVTLAVLPFDDLGGIPAFLAQGLPRNLRDRLARIRGLRVIADTASFSAARETVDLRELASKLGAQLLIGGSLQVEGPVLKTRGQLTDVESGALTWTFEHRGSLEDLGDVEASISAALAEHLIQFLGPDRIEAVLPTPPADPVTHRMLLEARELTVQMLNSSIGAPETQYSTWLRLEGIYREVLLRDPENAVAFVRLGAMAERGQLAEVEKTTIFERWERAGDYYRRALENEPNNPLALAGLAEFYRRFEWRWAESENGFQRANAINPNSPETRTFYAYLLATLGRCVEALEQAEIGIALEPGFAWRRYAKPRILKALGRDAESDALYRQELVAAPSNVFLLREVFWAFLARRDGKALAALRALARDKLWAGAPPAPIAQVVERIGLAIDALDGRPTALLDAIDADFAAFNLHDSRTPAIVQSRFSNDLIFGLSVEAAAAGDVDKTISLLAQAVGLRSLYMPEILPFGPHEFGPAIRDQQHYQAIWRSDPALVQLVESRRRAQLEGQMLSAARN